MSYKCCARSQGQSFTWKKGDGFGGPSGANALLRDERKGLSFGGSVKPPAAARAPAPASRSAAPWGPGLR